MTTTQLDFQGLARRAAAGDVQARNLLQEQLGPQLERIVRRSLLHGGCSRLDATIHAEARRQGSGLVAEPERQAAPVAESLGQRLLERLWPGQIVACQDTAVA